MSDACWVCGCKFIDDGGSSIREDHHIIPRCYGGTDGPQVPLCDTHHSKLHRIADRIYADKNYHEFLHGEPQGAAIKLQWLASRVYNARLMFENDPNRRVLVSFGLDPEAKAKIEKLKKVYPRIRSREGILLLALDLLYKRHFS